MESVRFSIIENDMRWEEQNLDEKDEISSEGSGGGSDGGIEMNLPECTTISQRYDNDIWKPIEINQTLRNLKNSEKIINSINSCDFSGIINFKEYINTALLLAVWLRKLGIVSKLLDIYHADPNTIDSKGRTPLHLSCSLPNSLITKILLRHGALPNQWDNTKKVTPLHCAASAGCCECVQLLLKNGANLNAGIEKRSALHYAVENNAINCVKILLQYGATPNTPQVYTETPLHVASALGHIECIKLLLAHGADVRSQYGKQKNTALHLAAEEDYTICAKLLLEGGAKIDTRNADNQTPLHIGCLSQSAETVDLLINNGTDVNAVYKDGRTALHAAIVKESKDWECAKLLISAGVDVNKADNYGYTPLHMAALNEYGSCAYLLIEHGADITARTNGGISALAFIVRRTPEIIPKYLGKFDSSIKVNDHEIGDVDCEIKLDFRLLVPSTERGETELLLTFIEVGQKRVLKHPLCETFLFLKWGRIRKFFLLSLFFHALFVLLFTLYVLKVYVRDCPKVFKMEASPCQSTMYITVMGNIVIFLNFVMLAKELFQMAHGFNSYVRYWENWLQWTIILGVFLCATPSTIITESLSEIPKWQHHIAAVVIFLVWLELMMLVGRFPIFGLYVQMFTKVAANFSKFLMAYCCLLIAFGLSFGVLFSNYPSFKSAPWALLKTVIMMSGELEFEDIFYGDTDIYYPGTAHAIFFAFVLLVTIILTNLLVGLAVSDIQGLQESAGLDRLYRQAELVSRLESLFFSKILRKAPPRILALCQRSALLRTSRCHLQFCIKPNDPREKRLPKELILSIYKLVAERRDRNQSLRRRKQIRNYSFFKRSLNHKENNNSSNNNNADVQLRKISTNNLRYRTVSENPYGSFHMPVMRQNDQHNSTEQITEVPQLMKKIEQDRELISKKLDELTKNLSILKVRLQS